MREFNKRLFTYKQFCHVVDLAMYSVVRKRKGLKLITKEFQNHIMLAVTEVNGCQACTWFHTKNAVRMNMSDQEIASLLSGTLEGLPEDEHRALLFAQHYADTFGVYNQADYEELISYYGEDKTEGIVATIRMIMFGNVNGIAFGSLKERIKGKKVSGSKFKYEVLNLIGVSWLIPYYLIKNIIKKR